jgi:hypothetical protein
MLEEGVSDHCYKRMTVKAWPGPCLEVVETEFFFHLLVSLLANPMRLDGGCQSAQVGLRRQVGEIVFLLTSCVRHRFVAVKSGKIDERLASPGVDFDRVETPLPLGR